MEFIAILQNRNLYDMIISGVDFDDFFFEVDHFTECKTTLNFFIKLTIPWMCSSIWGCVLIIKTSKIKILHQSNAKRNFRKYNTWLLGMSILVADLSPNQNEPQKLLFGFGLQWYCYFFGTIYFTQNWRKTTNNSKTVNFQNAKPILHQTNYQNQFWATDFGVVKSMILFIWVNYTNISRNAIYFQHTTKTNTPKHVVYSLYCKFLVFAKRLHNKFKSSK